MIVTFLKLLKPKRMFNFLRSNDKDEPYHFPQPSAAEAKRKIRIGFIDDKKFKIVDLLKQEGWTRIDYVEDILSLTDHFVLDHDVLFIDIQGVGVALEFEKEGLGLLKALREQYPEKVLIAYSAESESKIDTFDEAFNSANFRLRKTAEPYEFIRLLKKAANIVFSHDYQLESLARKLSDASNQKITSDQLQTALNKSSSAGKVDKEALRKHLSLSNIASVAEIIGLFV